MATPEDLRAARQAVGESQEVFAARFGVDQSTIHRWETDGIPGRGTTAMLVDAVLAGLKSAASEPLVEGA